MNQKARLIMAELDKKYDELDKTRKQLKASLDIQMLWPEAFKNGKCVSYLGGNLFEFKTMRFVIKNGIGEIKEFELTDIPDHLLKRAIEFQAKPNGHNRQQCSQLDNLYKYIQSRKKINKRKE